MPKTKSKTTNVKSDTVACPFCQGQMLPEDLKGHITQFHMTTPTQPQPQTNGPTKQQYDRLPLLDAPNFDKHAVNGTVTGTLISCRLVNNERFHGLAMDFEDGKGKFSFLARFDRLDAFAIVKQLVGGQIRFIKRTTDRGGVFVNVELPKRQS